MILDGFASVASAGIRPAARKAGWLAAAVFVACRPFLIAGETLSDIPPAELQALDRAIARELNSGRSGTHTLGDLVRLKNRLLARRALDERREKSQALAPLAGEDSLAGLRAKLENEAGQGIRGAKRSLAFLHLAQNEPEKALEQWQGMGKASDYDLSFLLVSAYLKFAVGEYPAGRADLEKSLGLMDARQGLGISEPVFCLNIMGYRLFVPRAAGDLSPGENVLIYVEVDGAEFFPSGEGTGCRLAFGLRLKDDSRHTVWADPEYGEYAPVFSGSIRDLHAALTWRVPTDLPPGNYRLSVETVDVASKLSGDNAVSFSVGRHPAESDSSPPEARRRSLPGANPALPGSPIPLEPPDLRNPEYYRRFELLRRYEQQQRVD
jgi:hypothetical protein